MTDWVTSGGGPLILLEELLLSEWSGSDPAAESDRIDPKFRLDITGPPTDYDRACSVDEVFELIPVGWGFGLVLAGAPNDTTWQRLGPDHVVIVRWEYADSESSVERAVQSVPSLHFTGEAGPWKLSGPLRLFDSAMPGNSIVTPSSIIDVPPGEYMVDTASFEPDERTSLLLHRLKRC